MEAAFRLEGPAFDFGIMISNWLGRIAGTEAAAVGAALAFAQAAGSAFFAGLAEVGSTGSMTDPVAGSEAAGFGQTG